MFYTYVLKSQRNGKRYIGSTGIEPVQRLTQHNMGCNRWTKYNRPFVLMYVESFVSRTEARQRENFLKSGQGRKWLDAQDLKSQTA